jgi:hypothetical protein
MLTAAFARATHPLLRRVRGMLAKDEAAHGRFGWMVLEHLVPELDERELDFLRAAAKSALERLRNRAERVRAQPKEMFGEISALGAFAPDEYRDLALRTIDRQIVSKLGALDLSFDRVIAV